MSASGDLPDWLHARLTTPRLAMVAQHQRETCHACEQTKGGDDQTAILIIDRPFEPSKGHAQPCSEVCSGIVAIGRLFRSSRTRYVRRTSIVRCDKPRNRASLAGSGPVRDPASYRDRHDRSQMAGAQAPQMQIGDACRRRSRWPPQLSASAPVRVHVQQDRAGVADQAVGPTGDHAGADRCRPADPSRASRTRGPAAGRRSPGPTRPRRPSRGRSRRACCCRVRASRARARVPRTTTAMVVRADPHMRGECVRLRDLFDGFQIAAAIGQGEHLAGAVRPHGLDRRRVRRATAVPDGAAESAAGRRPRTLQQHGAGTPIACRVASSPCVMAVARGRGYGRDDASPPLSSHALAMFTARPRQAIGIASAKWIGTGANKRHDRTRSRSAARSSPARSRW